MQGSNFVNYLNKYFFLVMNIDFSTKERWLDGKKEVNFPKKDSQTFLSLNVKKTCSHCLSTNARHATLFMLLKEM